MFNSLQYSRRLLDQTLEIVIVGMSGERIMPCSGINAHNTVQVPACILFRSQEVNGVRNGNAKHSFSFLSPVTITRVHEVDFWPVWD